MFITSYKLDCTNRTEKHYKIFKINQPIETSKESINYIHSKGFQIKQGPVFTKRTEQKFGIELRKLAFSAVYSQQIIWSNRTLKEILKIL